MTDLKPIVSSMISAAGYDEASKTLKVQFSGGATYEYAGVPATEYQAFLSAPSAGKHFSANIKSKYTAKKLEA